MKLIVGLGNPGPKYEQTRHNLGFMTVDEIARSLAADWRQKFNGDWARGTLEGEDVVLLKPSTFMNESARSVQPAAAFFQVAPSADELLVVHDELEIPFADVRLKVGGGHSGHNGLRSIIGALGPEFARVRVGIGRPPAEYRGTVADYLLSAFEPTETASLPKLVDGAFEMTRRWVAKGPVAAMTKSTRPQAR